MIDAKQAVKELYSLVPEDALEPDWKAFEEDKGKKVHEWKSYIHPALRLVWLTLSIHTRNEFAANAQWIADKEDWE